MIRILFSVIDEKCLDARISDTFTKTHYIVIIDVNDKGDIVGMQCVPRTTKHSEEWEYKAFYIEPKSILLYEPDIIITREMGPHAVDIFHRSGIKVFLTEEETVSDALTAFKENRLQELF